MNANDPLETNLREISWRRKLTPAEEAELRAWLAKHPEAEGVWQAEAKLNEILSGLPDAPVSTNFTARVLDAVGRVEAAEAQRRETRWSWRSFLPKAAVATVVVTASLLGYRGHQIRQRAEMGRSVTAVTGVASAPGPDILADFDAIAQMPQTGFDENLLTLMQQ